MADISNDKSPVYQGIRPVYQGRSRIEYTVRCVFNAVLSGMYYYGCQFMTHIGLLRHELQYLIQI